LLVDGGTFVNPKKQQMHDFEMTSPLKPKILKISSSDKALKVIEDDGKLLVLEVTSNEDEEVDSGHSKSNPHDINMKLNSIDPPFEFCPHPIVIMQATNLIEIEQFTPPPQVYKTMILVQTTSNTLLNTNICIKPKPIITKNFIELMPFSLHHSSSLTQIISTVDAKLDVAISIPCSPSLLLVDSNLFQEKVIKNKEEVLVLECSIVILEARKKRPQLSLVDIQGTLI
jgi:hypothetical protein